MERTENLLLGLFVNPTVLKKYVNKAPNNFRILWMRQFISVLRNAQAWYLGLAFGIYTGQWITIIGFLPVIYSAAGISKVTAGMLTAAAAFVNIFGNIAAAILMHRGVSKSKILISGYFLIMIMPVFAFSDFTPDIPAIRYIAILFFSAIGGVIPATTYTLAVKIAPSEDAIAVSVGWVQQLTSIGMLLTPPLIAKIAFVAGGWQWTWVVTCTGAFVGMFLSALVALRYEKFSHKENPGH